MSPRRGGRAAGARTQLEQYAATSSQESLGRNLGGRSSSVAPMGALNDVDVSPKKLKKDVKEAFALINIDFRNKQHASKEIKK